MECSNLTTDSCRKQENSKPERPITTAQLRTRPGNKRGDQQLCDAESGGNAGGCQQARKPEQNQTIRAHKSGKQQQKRRQQDGIIIPIQRGTNGEAKGPQSALVDSSSHPSHAQKPGTGARTRRRKTAAHLKIGHGCWSRPPEAGSSIPQPVCAVRNKRRLPKHLALTRRTQFEIRSAVGFRSKTRQPHSN